MPSKSRFLQVREAMTGFDGISLRRFWSRSGSEGVKADKPAVVDGGGPLRSLVGIFFRVSTRDKLFVMTRWFPPPPREDLV